ncbi:MAG TPA: peptidase domain-containing ABC transporter, partial [Steroidobacteraceae bacterium]|nr:peptidase domain-containing ABC transporter [Steroidobacteraceae bacterium]
DLFQRVQSNTALRDVFTTRTVSALLDGLLVAGYTALMISYSPRLSAVVIILAVPRVLFLILVRRRNRHYMAAELAAAGRESSVLVEALSVLETIKASGAETDVVRRWGNRLAQRVNASLDRRRLEIASAQLMSVVQGLSMAAVLWLAGREVIDGGMTLGVFAAFLTLQSLFLTPLESLLDGVNQLQYLNSHLFRLDDVLETSREASGTVDPGRLSGAIEVDDVSFAYTPGGPDIVRSVTLHIEPGQKVALVGPTGAGKSTLAHLILGMHLPSSGAIRLDGIELREMDLMKLRRQMGVVLQDAFFFSDTVSSNVTLGEQVPLERLYAAVSDAGLDQVIDALPEGYATRLAQNGSMLSGGERQRLALARALVRDPAVLLLDEATSALDAESEARVHANLARRGVTRIVITHRLASVEDADRIFVLNGGSIVQQGDFETLLAQGGLFRELVAHPEQTHA